MLLAELEIWHSRPVAPTRRVALGHAELPFEPAPGFGGLLLGGIVAAHVADVDLELIEEIPGLVADIAGDAAIAQPRLRHRFQVDRIGLARSRHRLVGAEGDRVRFEIETEGRPETQLLGAVYAARLAPVAVRAPVLAVLRRALRWTGDVGPELVSYLAGGATSGTWALRGHGDPRQWALAVLGFEVPAVDPDRVEVRRRFRDLISRAHPDHGGNEAMAASRIAELTEARRILLAAAP